MPLMAMFAVTIAAAGARFGLRLVCAMISVLIMGRSAVPLVTVAG